MPRIRTSAQSVHRIHLYLDADDYHWLRVTFGGERQVSETFRRIISHMRGTKHQNPNLNLAETLAQDLMTRSKP